MKKVSDEKGNNYISYVTIIPKFFEKVFLQICNDS